MIEITTGSLEERIIKILQKTYPITVKDIKEILNLSKATILRTLNKLKTKGIVKLDILPDKIYIRLLRRDFRFVGKKRQRKFIKHKSSRKTQKSEEYNGIMYS